MKSPFSARPFGAVCYLSFMPALACAEELPTRLDNIAVTADRVARSVDETLAAVTIITREEIRKNQDQSVMDALARVPGINIKNDGGQGKVSSVFLRGTNSSHVLVLVDGIKVGAAFSATAPFQNIPLEQIERIEVVRGPRSSQYGSEAIGGVIQIFTRQGGYGFQPEISVSAGSHNTLQGYINLGGGDKRSWYNLNLASEKTDGINVLDSYVDYPAPDFAPVTVRENDRDGYRRNSILLTAGHRFANAMSTEFTLTETRGDNDYDGSFVNQSDIVQRTIGLRLDAPLRDNLDLAAQIGQHRDESDDYKNGVLMDFFHTRRDVFNLQANLDTGDSGLLTTGVDFQQENIASLTSYAVDSRKNRGAFAGYQYEWNANRASVSVRHDDNEQFGSYVTGGVSIGRDLTGKTRVWLSAGKAFKAPAFSDLYYPFGGNPDLHPEKSSNLEVGLSRRLDQGRLGLNLYQNHIKNIIEWIPQESGLYSPVNSGRAKISGLEMEHAMHWRDWSIHSSLALQKPQYDNGGNKGNTLIYRPRQILNLDIERKSGKFLVGANLLAESKRYADAANTDTLGGYAKLDLRAEYAFNRHWHAGVKIGNALDKSYETDKGYIQDGINGLLTVRYAAE